MIKEIKKGIIIALSFVLTLGLIGISYAAFIDITTVTPSNELTADLINDIINNQKDLDTRIGGTSIPTGAIMAFNFNICPTGWSQADGNGGRPDLRGVFVRGMESFDNGVTSSTRDPDRSGTATLGTYQADNLASHRHSLSWTTAYPNVAGGGSSRYSNYNSTGYTNYTGGNETRSKNVAVLYCVKD